MRINSKKYKGLFITLVGVLFLLSLGITYAYFSLGVTGNENATNMTTTMGTLKITYEETNNIVEENIEPKWTASKTITVENTGSLPATYSLLWDNLVNEITDNELIMGLSCSSDGVSCAGKNINVTLDTTNDVYTYTHSSNAVVPNSGNNINIQTDFEIEAGKTHTIVLTFYFKETNTTQDYNQGKTFTGKLKVGEKAIVPTPANTIIADLVENPGTINYKQPSSASNGEGLFKYTKLTSQLITGENNVIDDPTGTSHEDIYYYRGNITNNNVIFGGYCWLIVRTTDTGGTKLLYNGPVQDAEIKCPSYRTTSSDLPLMDTSERWDPTGSTDVRYAGSGPKTVLDNWYSTWTTNNPGIDDKLEEIVWCNDVNNQTLLESSGDYPAKDRLYDASTATPQLECKYEADRYTSKIGLLTADEAVLAGQAVLVNDSTNKNSYINIANKYWWLGSPYNRTSSNGGVFYSYGVNVSLCNDNASNTNGVRGSVSLSPSVSVTSGSGTPTDPYMIE